MASETVKRRICSTTKRHLIKVAVKWIFLLIYGKSDLAWLTVELLGNDSKSRFRKWKHVRLICSSALLRLNSHVRTIFCHCFYKRIAWLNFSFETLNNNLVFPQVQWFRFLDMTNSEKPLPCFDVFVGSNSLDHGITQIFNQLCPTTIHSKSLAHSIFLSFHSSYRTTDLWKNIPHPVFHLLSSVSQFVFVEPFPYWKAREYNPLQTLLVGSNRLRGLQYSPYGQSF